MKAEQFIKQYQPKMSEYCPVVITADGDVLESVAGHIQTLVSLSDNPDILNTVPKDVSPLMYLAGVMKCVIVDYENQIYMEELTLEQETALQELVSAGLITDHRIRMTHEAAKI